MEVLKLTSFQRKCGKFVRIRGLSHVGRLIWFFASSDETDACGRRMWATGVLLVLGQPCMRWCFNGILAPDHIGKFWCIQKFGDSQMDSIRKQGLAEDKEGDEKPVSYKHILHVRIFAGDKCHPNEVIHLRQVEIFDHTGKNWALATNGGQAKQASVHSTL